MFTTVDEIAYFVYNIKQIEVKDFEQKKSYNYARYSKITIPNGRTDKVGKTTPKSF